MGVTYLIKNDEVDDLSFILNVLVHRNSEKIDRDIVPLVKLYSRLYSERAVKQGKLNSIRRDWDDIG